MTVQLRQPLPASPCVGVCEMDAASGLCRGCARTGEEIGWWRDAPEARRAAVWAALPERSRRLGLPYRRLDWDAARILAHAGASLREGRGRWTAEGGPRRAAFAGPAAVTREGATLVARAEDAAFRLRVESFVRAFEEVTEDRPARLMLVLPVGRAEAARAKLDARDEPGVAEGPIARVEVAAEAPLAPTPSPRQGERGRGLPPGAFGPPEALTETAAPPSPPASGGRDGVRGAPPTELHAPPLPALPSAWVLGAVFTPFP